MLVYFLVLLIPLLFAFTRPSRGARRDIPLFGYFIILLIFTGLRDQVGADWSGYQNILDIASGQSLADALSNREFGFSLINILSLSLGWGIYGVNFFCALIFLSGVFLYARTTANAWLAIASVTPFLIFIISMSGIRQSAAIGIGFMMFARWDRSSLQFKLAMIALATSIHNSAIIFTIFLVIKFDRFLWLRALAAGMIAILSIGMVADTAAFSRYNQVYIQNNLQSGGAFFHVMLCAFPAMLYLAFRRRIAAYGGRNSLLDVGAWMSLLAIPLLFFASTGASRASLYLSFLQMWIYPIFAAVNGRWRILVTAACAIMFVAIFFVYFMSGTYVYTYLPYRSILFN